jgi:tRNAThr (cytosine32-N3)-methyltransferase
MCWGFLRKLPALSGLYSPLLQTRGLGGRSGRLWQPSADLLACRYFLSNGQGLRQRLRLLCTSSSSSTHTISCSSGSSSSSSKSSVPAERVGSLRLLQDTHVDPQRVFQHNSWDNVEWSEEEKLEAFNTVKSQQINCMDQQQSDLLLLSAHSPWNKFYHRHNNNFFKDRRWLNHEIGPIIDEMKTANITNTVHIMEVGCGVGNSVFPLLESRLDVNFTAFDFSTRAVSLLQKDVRYDSERVNSFVFDVSGSPNSVAGSGAPLTEHVAPASVDIVLMLHALSAIEPTRHAQVLANVVSVMKPGAVIVFRDYALYDQSQLQFKNGRCIKNNLYARGDGTLVHFFTETELAELCGAAGLSVEESKTASLLVINRKMKKAMKRLSIQGKYRKVSSS